MAACFAWILLVLTLLAVQGQDASRIQDIGAPDNVTKTTHGHGRTTTTTTEPLDPFQEMDIDWNIVIDYVITTLQSSLLANNNDDIAIPNIDREFASIAGFIPVHFSATSGKLGRLSTLHRVGDVIVSARAGPVYLLTCAVGLHVLRVRYDRYVARVWGHGPHGVITARAGDNALRVTLVFHVTEEGECTADLDDVTVTQLEDLQVGVTGMGWLNGLASRVASAQIAKRKDSLIETVEDSLTREMEHMLEGFRCDEYLGMLTF